MKAIMKRAWEIFKNLTGDHVAKLAMALRQAWAERKNGGKNMTVEMIEKYHIELRGENIAVSAPKQNRNMEEISWIKEHKAEIVEELKKREAVERARTAAFNELRKTNPEMRRGKHLTEKAISRVVNDNWNVLDAVREYRSIYADVMDSRF